MEETKNLRKLAAVLREYADKSANSKRQKLANLVVASTGLELLRRKIHGDN